LPTDSATDDLHATGSDGVSRAIRSWCVSPAAGWWLWGASIAALAILIAWILWDPKFQEAVVGQKSQLYALTHTDASPPKPITARTALLWMLTGVGGAAAVGVLVTLFVGSATHRSLRSWFALTLLVAAWLTVCVGWPEIAWQGRRFGVWRQLKSFAAVEASLQHDWPMADGDRPELGPFTAYPKDIPRTLMLLTSNSSLPITAVDRAADKTFRVELRGAEPGTWLESHHGASQPGDFTGGIEDEHRLQRSSPLGNGWYLVRYR
jgi:hypothetical protein